MRPRLIASENVAKARAKLRELRRFNEAEAHRLGKRADEHAQPLDRRASMRPRLIASENSQDGRAVQGRHRASMRPRLIASENRTWSGAFTSG